MQYSAVSTFLHHRVVRTHASAPVWRGCGFIVRTSIGVTAICAELAYIARYWFVDHGSVSIGRVFWCVYTRRMHISEEARPPPVYFNPATVQAVHARNFV